jgi:hypothetical protein
MIPYMENVEPRLPIDISYHQVSPSMADIKIDMIDANG